MTIFVDRNLYYVLFLDESEKNTVWKTKQKLCIPSIHIFLF